MIGKVLIVDDEPLVRCTLRKMIESNPTGWHIVGEAQNGREALAALDDSDPDLIVTDVRMPMMNGLELAEEIHNGKRDRMVVILTGHKDFEYAQTALRHGVLEFLLKPCSEQEVCAMLRRLLAKLSEEEIRRLREARSTEEATIRAWAHRMPYDNNSMKRLQSEWSDGFLCSISVKSYYPAHKTYRASDLLILQFGIDNIIREMAESLYVDARVVLIRHDQFFVLFKQHPQDQGPISDEDLFQRIVEKVRKLMGIELAVNLIGPFTALSDPGLAEGLPLLRMHTFHYDKLKTLENRFMSFIVSGQLDLLEQNFQSILLKIAQLSLEEAHTETLGMVLTLDTIARKHWTATGNEHDGQANIRAVHELESTAEVVHWLSRELERFLHLLNESLGCRSTGIIQRAIAYMERSYMSGCSLQDVAAHVYLNPKYFSVLFKKETGENFVQYLTRIRLQKAQMLLNNTELPVTEIAIRAGYDDPNYFSTVFRKDFGMSPNEYRKSRIENRK